MGSGFDLYELKTSTSLPGPASLERNVQLCLYSWCCVTGELQIDGKWVSVGSIEPQGSCHVRLSGYPTDHPFARIRPTDNVVLFRTTRYRTTQRVPG